MKKKDTKWMGLQIPQRMRMAGRTFYVRQGQVIGRPSTMHEKRSNTLPQFIQRQKMRHTTALWKTLRYCDVMFTERRNACQNFMSLANRLPVVYVPDNGVMNQASFLMPGIPVSDGALPQVKQELGEVEGMPAFITNLSPYDEYYNERLLFYTAVQQIEGGMPRVRFSVRELSRDDMTVHPLPCPADSNPRADEQHSCLVLMGEEFTDEMKGWALVRVINDRCSPQGIVTRCRLYQQYTTEKALEVAAESYGGLTEPPFLSAR